MRMKSIFYILLSVLLFSCGGREEIRDNNWHKFLTLKTPVATTNPAGEYTVDYVFEYDSSSLELKAELIPSGDSVLPTFSSVTKSGTLNFNLSDPSDSIKFLVKIIEGAHQGDYSVVLTNIISKHKDSASREVRTLPKNIVLDDRVLKGKDEWNIDYTKDLYEPYFEYNIPFSKTKIYIIIGSLLLILGIIIYLLTRPGKLWGIPMFKGEDWLIVKAPTRDKIKLEGTKEGEDDISANLGLPSDLIKCIPRNDVDAYNVKHVFVTLEFSSNLSVTLSNSSAKMSASRIYSGEKLFHLDEINILYNEQKIKFQYTNPNIRR